MMLADFTVKIDYVMYPAIVGAVGLALGIAVKMLRRFDLSAFPFWAVLMVAGAGAFGFAIGDMPNGPPHNASMDSNQVKEVNKVWMEAGGYESQSRLLPRWADGALCGVGVCLFACGVGLLFWKLETSPTSPKEQLLTPKLQTEFDILKKMIVDCVGMPTNGTTEWQKAVISHLVGAGFRDAGARELLEKINKTVDAISDAQDGQPDDATFSEEFERLGGKLAESIKSPPALTELSKIVETQSKQIADLVKVADGIVKKGSVVVTGERIPVNAPVVTTGGGFFSPLSGKIDATVTAGSSTVPVVSLNKGTAEVVEGPKPSRWILWGEAKPEPNSKIQVSWTEPPLDRNSTSMVHDVDGKGDLFLNGTLANPFSPRADKELRWRYVDGKQLPVKSVSISAGSKPSEWVKWSEHKPEVGSQIYWTPDPAHSHYGNNVFYVVADDDPKVKEHYCISSKWVADRHHDVVWRYVDEKQPPSRKTPRKHGVWTNFEDEKPEVGRPFHGWMGNVPTSDPQFINQFTWDGSRLAWFESPPKPASRKIDWWVYVADEEKKSPPVVESKIADDAVSGLKKEVERIDGWVRYRDERPEPNRRIFVSHNKLKPDLYGGCECESRSDGVYYCNIRQKWSEPGEFDQDAWWKYADDEPAPGVWVRWSERKPEPGRCFNFYEREMGDGKPPTGCEYGNWVKCHVRSDDGKIGWEIDDNVVNDDIVWWRYVT